MLKDIDQPVWFSPIDPGTKPQVPAAMQRIVIGGMQRSGSTWLCNAVQAVSAAVGHPYATGYNCMWKAGDGCVQISKDHTFKPRYKDAFVLVTVRHPLDAAASFLAMPWLSHIGKYKRYKLRDNRTRKAIREFITRPRAWRPHADAIIKFEDMMADKAKYVEWIRDTVYPGAVIDIAAIVTELEDLPGKTGLPHRCGPDHRTGVGIGGGTKKLPADLRKYIIREFKPWFEAYGYEIDNTSKGA